MKKKLAWNCNKILMYRSKFPQRKGGNLVTPLKTNTTPNIYDYYLTLRVMLRKRFRFQYYK